MIKETSVILNKGDIYYQIVKRVERNCTIGVKYFCLSYRSNKSGSFDSYLYDFVCSYSTEKELNANFNSKINYLKEIGFQ